MMKETLTRFFCAMDAETRVKTCWNEEAKDVRKGIVVIIPPNFKMIC
jgi:hypothetical protein